MQTTETLRRWRCQVCGWIYDEAQGDPDSGIPSGTRWRDVPDDWKCPDCAAAKADFRMLEMAPEASALDADDVPLTDAAPDLMFGTQTQGYQIDAAVREIHSSDVAAQPYRSVVVVTGSSVTPNLAAQVRPGEPLKPGELVLDDGLRAPTVVDYPAKDLWARFAAWWWGA